MLPDSYAQSLVDLEARQSRIEVEVEKLAVGLDATQSQLAATQTQLAALVRVTEKNQEQLGALVRETRDLIQLYRDARGAARIGAKIQSFLIWITKWPLIGVGVLTLLSSLRTYLKTKGVDL